MLPTPFTRLISPPEPGVNRLKKKSSKWFHSKTWAFHWPLCRGSLCVRFLLGFLDISFKLEWLSSLLTVSPQVTLWHFRLPSPLLDSDSDETRSGRRKKIPNVMVQQFLTLTLIEHHLVPGKKKNSKIWSTVTLLPIITIFWYKLKKKTFFPLVLFPSLRNAPPLEPCPQPPSAGQYPGQNWGSTGLKS